MPTSVSGSPAPRHAAHKGHKKTGAQAAPDALNWQAALLLVVAADPNAAHVAGNRKSAPEAHHDKAASGKAVAAAGRGKALIGRRTEPKPQPAHARPPATMDKHFAAEHMGKAAASDVKTQHDTKTSKTVAPLPKAKAVQLKEGELATTSNVAQKHTASQQRRLPERPSITKTLPVNGEKSKMPVNAEPMPHNRSGLREASPAAEAATAMQRAALVNADGQSNEKATPKPRAPIIPVHSKEKTINSVLGAGSPSAGAALGAAKPDSFHSGPGTFSQAVLQSQAAVAGGHNSTPLSAQSLHVMAAQIHLLHQTGGGQAHIRLDPPSLGSVQVQLQMQQQNQAQVSFTAAQQATAEALQAALPKLASAMHQNGIQLVHSQVNVDSETALSGQTSQHGAQGQAGQFGQSQHQDGRWPGSGGHRQNSRIESSRPARERNAGARAYA
jgi:flagellar hook-length control protein FliK